MEIVLPDPASVWTGRGFALDAGGRFVVGGIGLRAGAPELALHAPLSPGAAGLPIYEDAAPGGPCEHPNGAFAVDHMVALTDDLARTSAALKQAGTDLRREMGRLHFHRVGALIIELAQTEEPRTRFWGLTFTVPELPTGDGYGEARDAVQAGRRIVTARGGEAAVAFMTPRP
jgi:hypothetical protein